MSFESMEANWLEPDDSPFEAAIEAGWLNPDDLSKAMLAVLDERHRQETDEGWTPEHDDKHNTGEMARAAACYALSGGRLEADEQDHHGRLAIRHGWPWAWSWWKPKDRRRDLVRAAALLIAEIERLDRATPPAVTRQVAP